ncbi:MAG TPA: hypothetical protein VFZ61_09145 [Polyangiales bacterium]
MPHLQAGYLRTRRKAAVRVDAQRGVRRSVLELAAREATPTPHPGSRLAGLISLLMRWLARPGAPVLVVLLALVLHAVSLDIGLTADDHFHAVALRDDLTSSGMERAPWDQFTFAKGAAINRAMMEEGAFPWWTDPELVIAFCRPLSSLTHWLDHRLWPRTPWLMHAHSLLWFAALLAAVWRLLRLLDVDRAYAIAPLAFLIYAVDDARSMPVGWLANRNALVALAPGFVALAAHVRWRTSLAASANARGEPRFALLAIGSFALALLGGEPAIPACGYLVAYAVCLERGSLAARARSLLPYGLLVFAWRLVYQQLGYGALHSGIYLDPGREPGAFGAALLSRLPILLLSEFALPPSDLWEAYPFIHPALKGVVLTLGVVLLCGLGWLALPLLRRQPTSRFWLLGTILATIPVCGTHPEDRVLTATSLGGSALLAELLIALSRGTARGPAGLQRAVGYGLLATHLVIAPLILPLRTLAIVSMEALLLESDASVPSGPAAAKQTVVLLNPPVDLLAVYLPPFRLSREIQGPLRLRWLATGESALRITRVDAHTLSVTPADGFLATSSQKMFRRPSRGFSLGDEVHLNGLTITVTQLMPDGRPGSINARFDTELDAESLTWLRWQHHQYVRFSPPAVGSSSEIPAVDVQELLFD